MIRIIDMNLSVFRLLYTWGYIIFGNRIVAETDQLVGYTRKSFGIRRFCIKRRLLLPNASSSDTRSEHG